MISTIALLAALLSPPWQPVDGAGFGPGENIVSATCPQADACYLLDAAGNVFLFRPGSWQWQWRSRQQRLQPVQIHFTGFLVGYLRSRAGSYWRSGDGGRSFQLLNGKLPLAVTRIFEGRAAHRPALPEIAGQLCPGNTWLAAASIPDRRQSLLLAGRAGSLALLPGQPASRVAGKRLCRRAQPVAFLTAHGDCFWLCRFQGVARLNKQGRLANMDFAGCRQVAPVGDNSAYVLDESGCLWFVDLDAEILERRACWPGARGGSPRFTNRLRGVILGDGGFRAVTVDGGRHWTLRKGNPQAASAEATHPGLRLPGGEQISDLARRDEFHLLAASRSGRVFMTENGGTSWTELELPNHARACRLSCLATTATCLVADCSGNLFLLRPFSL